MSRKLLFNDGWEFTKQELHTSLEVINGCNIIWTPVDIPHDWLIYNTANLYETSEGWYRKTFSLHEEMEGNRIAIRFEGVYMDAAVYVNDMAAGEWKYGYSTFEFDITDLLKKGENEIRVRVSFQSPNSRWYSGAGIYRNVWLKTMPAAHIVSDGIYISARKVADSWAVDVETETVAEGRFIGAKAAVSGFVIRHSIMDKTGSVITVAENEIKYPAEVQRDHQVLSVRNPVLWDLENPVLYSLRTELITDRDVIEEEVQRFGFRMIEFDPEKGFSLNGNRVKLHGVCNHHDLGCLGAAVNRTALRRQFVILKEMGVNALRTAHNMPAVEFMELADEMGLLVVSEAFDMWERPKNKYDYARFFKEWAERDVANWIRRDRNHPSIIMWCIGNEIYDTHAGERGQELTRNLMGWVHYHDPRGNAGVTLGSNYMPWENAQKCADIVKLAGYNYAEKYYDKHHKEHPDWVIYGSETASVVLSRGIYHFPASQSVLADDDEQCSALGNSSTSWGARSVEACIIDDRDAYYSPGQFIWSGFDYIGEPTPYHTKNSYFGQIDTAGFPKDSFYIYQAEWTDYREYPMVHIFPYWDFNEGQLIDVRVCSNAPKIELFFNGESKGTFDIDHAKGNKLLGEWQFPYRKGMLKAVAYDENGAVVAADSRNSFGDAAKIVLTPDKTELLADGRDLIFVEISMVDASGNPVENANNRVDVSVQGAGRLVGLDNGDSTDYDQYKGTSRKLFSGKLLAVIAARLEPGEICMKVVSEDLKSQKLLFKALPCERPEGLTALEENEKSESGAEIPVRKIALVSKYGNQLNENLTEICVDAELYPANATYRDVEWRVTNDAGIDTNIATVDANAGKAVVKALGDGKFRLRCMSRNGSDKIRLISQMEFSITGLGERNLNPYQFISGGLYNASNRELTNGNDRGVATLRDGESHVGFKGIDFGEYGSDEITIPIFALGSEEYPLQIWEGMPEEEGSEMLADVIYQKEMIWNVYQEQTYKLARRLKGVTTLCFVLHGKVHIKGFWFTKLMKAYQQLRADENNRIYGDTFTVAEDAIVEIGNNVSLEYDNMDFGGKGFNRLIICGHSPIDKNTIHIRFSGENGEVKQIAEFLYSEEYVEREFVLDNVTGLQKVTFVFLPGCRFDLKWFRFVE
jgi:beta-galactosidase